MKNVDFGIAKTPRYEPCGNEEFAVAFQKQLDPWPLLSFRSSTREVIHFSLQHSFCSQCFFFATFLGSQISSMISHKFRRVKKMASHVSVPWLLLWRSFRIATWCSPRPSSRCYAGHSSLWRDCWPTIRRCQRRNGLISFLWLQDENGQIWADLGYWKVDKLTHQRTKTHFTFLVEDQS